MYRVRREVGRMGCYVGRVRENHESGVLANYGRMRSTGVYNAEGVVGPTASVTKRARAAHPQGRFTILIILRPWNNAELCHSLRYVPARIQEEGGRRYK